MELCSVGTKPCTKHMQPLTVPPMSARLPTQHAAQAGYVARQAEVYPATAAPPLPASLANARVHPGEISESVLLASVAAPSLVDVDPGAALEACANSGALSALQLEGALRAAAAPTTRPSSRRRRT